MHVIHIYPITLHIISDTYTIEVYSLYINCDSYVVTVDHSFVHILQVGVEILG